MRLNDSQFEGHEQLDMGFGRPATGGSHSRSVMDGPPAPAGSGGSTHEQLPMIMRASDIPKRYGPWPNDKNEIEYEVEGVSQPTGRTDSQGIRPYSSSDHWPQYDSRVETDEETWARKYDEGSGSPVDYLRDELGMGTGSAVGHLYFNNVPPLRGSFSADRGMSMYSREDDTSGWASRTNPNYRPHRSPEWGSHHDHLRANGIEDPIPVGQHYLLGGHHRVAWAARDRPNMEVPVAHIPTSRDPYAHDGDSISDAKSYMTRHFGQYR